jgi:hypothetical protein
MCCGGKLTAFLRVHAIPDRISGCSEEMIEITPVVEVTGPSHNMDLIGVVSNQSECDEGDIKISGDKIFVRPKSYNGTDRIFTITYHVNCHDMHTFASTKVVVENGTEKMAINQ